MKKILFTSLILIIGIISFSSKFIYVYDGNKMTADMYNVEKFGKISITSDYIILGNSDSSYDSNTVKIPITFPLEEQKYDKINDMINKGYIVKPKEDNKYFKTSMSRNLTVYQIKEIKVNALIKDFLKFMESNNSIFNINDWAVEWIMAIPVD
ncbi:MAG: hypothetical protein PWP28_1826 [Oceanotoga sp.]|uniref:Uncharacterized protein n=1 Tax=Oceanotoga teriensis TaxID=515440 RepID=A0AA45C9C9_9BACT|nr:MULTISPECIES: hypothetical protein [Oceanotoga]MDN5342951.1 hypothetical protein [Oceanotoga sp.]PWJ96650.1 hypothetical protein C7380_101224 [Oceanotoga teriensis]